MWRYCAAESNELANACQPTTRQPSRSYPQDGTTASTLIAAAEQAMYRCKIEKADH